jgi:hypothetical protein
MEVAVVAESRTVPEVTRSDVGMVAVAEWSTDTQARQRAVADAAIEAWNHMEWPEGLLSHACLLGTDGRTVMHYIQSADEEAARWFVSSGKVAWTRAVEDAAPPFQRHGVVGYRVYRGQYFTVSTSAPGCVVAVRREFDGPDPQRARAWVDAMFAATGDAAPLPGMIAAHMHVSVDGSRVLNLAQWTSEQAHQALVDGASDRMAENPALRQLEKAWPGLEHTTIRRNRPYRYVERAPRRQR